MGYFSYLASSQFQKTEDGKSLFYLGLRGPFSKPYIIETPEQEAVLKKRVTNFYRIFFTVLLIVIVFGMNFLYTDIKRFFLFIILGTALWYVLLKLWVSKEIRNMKKSDSKISLHQFYKSMSAKHSFVALLLGFIGSLGFVALGFLCLRLKTNIPSVIFVFSIVFFGICALAWGYALLLKRKK